MLLLKLPFLLSPRLSRPLMLLSLLALGSPLVTACATTSTGRAAELALACSTYGDGISYDSTRDTSQTVREVRVHNQSFENLGCDLGP